jgi:hypothetical protein
MVILAGHGARWKLAPHRYIGTRLQRIEYDLTDDS